jgi:hypothetical protein
MNEWKKGKVLRLSRSYDELSMFIFFFPASFMLLTSLKYSENHQYESSGACRKITLFTRVSHTRSLPRIFPQSLEYISPIITHSIVRINRAFAARS